jgi:hypothetical protein
VCAAGGLNGRLGATKRRMLSLAESPLVEGAESGGAAEGIVGGGCSMAGVERQANVSMSTRAAVSRRRSADIWRRGCWHAGAVLADVRRGRGQRRDPRKKAEQEVTGHAGSRQVGWARGIAAGDSPYGQRRKMGEDYDQRGEGCEEDCWRLFPKNWALRVYRRC